MGTVKVGERIPVGQLIYSVIDTQWAVSLGTDPAPRIPKSRFFLVNLSIVNSSGSDKSVPSFDLIDDQGQSYPELANGEAVPAWIGIARQIHPADSMQGNIVFDVEPKHYRLKVGDETEQSYAFIDIPLDFGTVPTTPDAGRDAIPGGPARRP